RSTARLTHLIARYSANALKPFMFRRFVPFTCTRLTYVYPPPISNFDERGLKISRLKNPCALAGTHDTANNKASAAIFIDYVLHILVGLFARAVRSIFRCIQRAIRWVVPLDRIKAN